MFNAYKLHWSESKKQVVLELTPACIYQREAGTSRILASYDYKDIEFLTHVSDMPNGVVLANHGFSRLHLFQCDERDALLRTIQDFAGTFIGISMRVRKEPVSLDQFWNDKFGKFSTDECITSLAEFTVYKVSERHAEPVRRLLCLSEVCLIERDPSTYSICTLKPLGEVSPKKR